METTLPELRCWISDGSTSPNLVKASRQFKDPLWCVNDPGARLPSSKCFSVKVVAWSYLETAVARSALQ